MEEFGQHAGEVWKKLEKHGTLSATKLMEMTRLKKFEFYAAVGWLAKENKIYKDGVAYKLGETNLTDEIGRDAGKLWNVLKKWGEVNGPYISRLAGLDEENTYYALGWLAREDKIKANRVKPPIEHQIKFELK